MHQDFQKFNPVRVPSWRYERVLKLAEHQPAALVPHRRRDDKVVKAYYKFWRCYDRTESEEERVALFPKNPGMFYAHVMHHHPDPEWRAILQARLLTRDSDEEIADRAGTIPSAIRCYEQIFFNVRDRLDMHDWIVKTILGTEAQRAANRYDSWTPHQRYTAYKLFAYFGGSLTLDVIISGFTSGDFPKQRADVGRWFDRTMQQLLKSKATTAARLFEVNKFNVMELMQISMSAIHHENKAGDGPQSEIEKSIDALLKEVPWGLARKGYGQLGALQQEYALGRVEPRAGEQMLLASGRTPAKLLEQAKMVDVDLITLKTKEE